WPSVGATSTRLLLSRLHLAHARTSDGQCIQLPAHRCFVALIAKDSVWRSCDLVVPGPSVQYTCVSIPKHTDSRGSAEARWQKRRGSLRRSSPPRICLSGNCGRKRDRTQP